MGTALSTALVFGFPLLARYAAARRWLPAWCSSIVSCYAIGIVIGNLRLWPIDGEFTETVAGGSMLLGLPLLLFSVRIKESLRHARGMLFSFALCCLCGLIATSVATVYFHPIIPNAWQAAGMLTGLYTGGTPNVQAIGLALEAPVDYLILIQSADVLLGGLILLGLLSFLPDVYARFLPDTEVQFGGDAGEMLSTTTTKGMRLPLQLLATLAVVALSAASCYLLTGAWLDPTVIILVLTTLSIVFTLTSGASLLGNTYPLGEYFVLAFCVALGLLADFRTLIGSGLDLLYFSALAIVITTALHLLLAYLFRIDRDTLILSYVAALYGPVFVAQVATSLGNRQLLAAGIGVSLIGFGVGNYLGVGIGLLLRALLG